MLNNPGGTPSFRTIITWSRSAVCRRLERPPCVTPPPPPRYSTPLLSSTSLRWHSLTLLYWRPSGKIDGSANKVATNDLPPRDRSQATRRVTSRGFPRTGDCLQNVYFAAHDGFSCSPNVHRDGLRHTTSPPSIMCVTQNNVYATCGLNCSIVIILLPALFASLQQGVLPTLS